MSRRLAWFIAVFVLVVAAAILDPKGFGHTRRLRDDVERIRGENRQLRTENQRLRAELRRLSDDPGELERAAREELGLVLPDEVIFHLEAADGSLPP